MKKFQHTYWVIEFGNSYCKHAKSIVYTWLRQTTRGLDGSEAARYFIAKGGWRGCGKSRKKRRAQGDASSNALEFNSTRFGKYNRVEMQSSAALVGYLLDKNSFGKIREMGRGSYCLHSMILSFHLNGTVPILSNQQIIGKREYQHHQHHQISSPYPGHVSRRLQLSLR